MLSNIKAYNSIANSTMKIMNHVRITVGKNMSSLYCLHSRKSFSLSTQMKAESRGKGDYEKGQQRMQIYFDCFIFCFRIVLEKHILPVLSMPSSRDRVR